MRLSWIVKKKKFEIIYCRNTNINQMWKKILTLIVVSNPNDLHLNTTFPNCRFALMWTKRKLNTHTLWTPALSFPIKMFAANCTSVTIIVWIFTQKLTAHSNFWLKKKWREVTSQTKRNWNLFLYNNFQVLHSLVIKVYTALITS